MKTTIKLSLFLLAALLVAAPVSAQMTQKELKKELRARVDRDAKKTAKSLTKEGWKTMPGNLSIERQIQDTQFAKLDKSESGDALYFIGSNRATGGNYSAAKQIADHRATLELSRAVSKAINEKIKDRTATSDLGDGDIELIDEFMSANQATVSIVLSGMTTTLALYRELPEGKFEVEVAVTVNAPKALKDVKVALKSKLAEQSEKLAESLDKMLNY